MKEYKVYNFEGKEYALVSELDINNIKYMQFVDINNLRNFCIRKISIIDGEEMIIGLDNKEEFDMVLSCFANKHIEDLEN